MVDMKENILDDTIAAIATAPGQGAIAIIRLSGPDTFKIIKSVFKGKDDIDKIEPWKAVMGKIYDKDREVDEVILIKYRHPHSYTREDMVEINCHGGSYVSQRILEVMITHGARVAQPGEFTMRAFLNGRIDLSQAEAVADLIQAQTESSLRTSIKQLEGHLSRRIKEIRDHLLDSCSLLELELDFTEEDVEFVDRRTFLKNIEQIQQELEQLISTYRIGRIAREGVKLVIVGKPNVGKSSLLNMLLKEERAIVTDIPGTTRDPLEVRLDLQGVLFRIFDTAGIKPTHDIIEEEGIKRTKKHLESADVIVHLFDGSLPLEEEDVHIMEKIEALQHKNIIRVINKTDLQNKLQKEKIFSNNIEIIEISALKGDNIHILEKKIVEAVIRDKKVFSDDVLVVNARHWQALKKAQESLAKTKAEIEKGVSSEFVSLFLRDALDSLGQIIGTVTSEDILNHIFSKFCIGK